MKGNYNDVHGNKKPPKMTNTMYDHIQQSKGWVGRDLDSMTKFILATATRFNVKYEEAEEAVKSIFGGD